MLFADGFNDALLGYAEREDYKVAVYSVKACIKILMRRDGMDYDGALDFFCYNVEGSYVGPETPIWVYSLEEMMLL